jgi:tetratricopeptide (TPR) repeat protein
MAQPSQKGSARLGSYLYKLRTGYGYSLRRVEERAKAEGGEIDNSQLSRYEKGICYPSFDKLRVLASVFNVSIQSFSDVVDLEGFEDLRPSDGDPASLVEDGLSALRAGDNGRAFAVFEAALERLAELPASAERRLLMGRARINQAAALMRLGKLALAEQELRQAMRKAEDLTPRLRVRALLALANIHADQGDNFLGEIEAERAHDMARSESLDQLAAMAQHTQARVLAERGQLARAIELYSEAGKLYAACGETYEAIRVRINTGGCFVDLGKTREGVRLLRSALHEARAGGHRLLVALAWHDLGEAYFRLGDLRRARSCFRESDAQASVNGENHHEILFANAFYEWRIARGEENPTREKIAFGRLKALRSGLERRSPEADEFDEFVERGRGHV